MRDLHREIYLLLSDYEELGVNAIAERLQLPVANIQRFLNRQEYFVKTDRRKWRLPVVDNEWPLFGEEDVPEPIVLSILDDPTGNVDKLLEVMAYYEKVAAVAERRVRYLKKLGQEVFQERGMLHNRIDKTSK